MNSRRAVVLDFDGTIANTIPLIKAIYKDLSEQNGWTPLTEEAYQELRKGNLRNARKWSGIRFWQLPLVVRSAKKLIKIESEKVAFYPEMEQFIQDMSKLPDTDLYVLSRNTHDTIAAVMERKKLSADLQILTIRRSFGGKTFALRRLIKKQGYSRDNVYMIGDEIRDMQAANRAKVKSIAVTWGLQDESILRRYNPTAVAHTVDDLRKILQS